VTPVKSAQARPEATIVEENRRIAKFVIYVASVDQAQFATFRRRFSQTNWLAGQPESGDHMRAPGGALTSQFRA
jgi:hypothetical protein